MIKINKIEWLEQPFRRLVEAQARHQLPHALLLHGASGTGRRLLAGRIAAHLLQVDATQASAEFPGAPQDNSDLHPAHPDVVHLRPLPDKKTIAIDQVRVLIDFLGLTSHQQGAKMAIIFPADSLTNGAANALLKTLEEPPGNSVLLLITEALSRLPATVVSRCHRVRIPKPGGEDALNWLNSEYGGTDWAPLLTQCGGAPLAALALQMDSGEKQMRACAEDLDQLVATRVSPASVAHDWQKRDPDVCLNWLFRRVASEIKQELLGGKPATLSKSRRGGLQNGGKMLNIDRSFEVLSELSELRRLKASGINTELHLANVLSRWYGA